MNLNSEINAYLKTQNLMSLATYGEYPWSSTVYFVHDENLNLYFMSKKDRIHSVAIERNPQVSVAITDSHQSVTLPQVGVQLWGNVVRIQKEEQIQWMFGLWKKLLIDPGSDQMFEERRKYLEIGVAELYKVVPKIIKYFNTKLWPKEEAQILEL